MSMRCICLLCLMGYCVVGGAVGDVLADQVIAQKNPKTGEVVLANESIRMRFHAPGLGQFGSFSKGYPGYSIDLKVENGWVPIASASYFTAFSYRSGWGRDWLAYVIPQTVEIQQKEDSATVVFSDIKWDMDRVRWDFTFVFNLKRGSSLVDVTYSAVPFEKRELMLMWGPRLCIGEGSFGSDKDEALFPGLEYLGRNERSSANTAIAPDSQQWFVPSPAKITIPLMSILHEGKLIGIMWDPMQKWANENICPSAVFASPNWLECKEHHLLGLFVPGVPKHVAENSLRAHTPAEIPAGSKISINAQIFAMPAKHTIDAIDLYLDEHDTPEPSAKPMSPKAAVEMCAKAMMQTAPTSQPSGWPARFGPGRSAYWPAPALGLIEAANHIEEAGLKQQVETMGRTVMTEYPHKHITAAFRVGGLAEAIDSVINQANDRIKDQQPDGSWTYQPTITDEQGLSGLNAPPWNKVIAQPGTKSQGITACELAGLFESILITGDQASLDAAMKGLEHLESYTIPYVYGQHECPPAPSLHGSYHALRCYLIAYKITGNKKHLERAVYWAKTGLPFIYLWSLPPQKVKSGQVHRAEKLNPAGEELYDDTRRHAMLYGGLYGYGSSQFSHHWFGLLVQWIALVYADDLIALSEYDQTLPWRTIADGIVTSAMWQMYDKPPYKGHLPDAFSLDSWMPSGPAFKPHYMLQAILRQYFGWDWRAKTVVARDDEKRCHITSSVPVKDASLEEQKLSFSMSDPDWSHVRAIVTGVGENPGITVDGVKLQRVDDLGSQEECWACGPAGLTLLKVKQATSSRHVVIHFSQIK